MASVCGRLAPSPTGLLHLGNAWSFLWAWTAARVAGGRVLLRMEDIDPARSRKEWEDNIVRDLAWLGLDWDEEPVFQSNRFGLYEKACDHLKAEGLLYPCYCTRKELRELAGAPHGAADGLGDAGAAYPGTCRHLTAEQRAAKEATGRRPAWRLACPENKAGEELAGVSFEDAICGAQHMTFRSCGGDFALRRSDGVWAYQLAVAVDDMDMGVTQIVRGEDILCSTPRQLLLYELLAPLFGETHMTFAHLPLLHDEEGERLAKRHNSMGLAALRDAGKSAEGIVGFLAHKAGVAEQGESLSPAEAVERIQKKGGLPQLWKALHEAGSAETLRVTAAEIAALPLV